MKKITLEQIEKARKKMVEDVKFMNAMKVYDKDFDKNCRKANSSIQNYKKLKGSYFYGNN